MALGTRLRTALFATATNDRHVEKALASDADAVILDLEDAVAQARKGDARESVARWAAAPRRGALVVRINALDTPHAYGDCAAVVRAGVDGIVLPKAARREDVAIAGWLLDQHERARGLPAGSIALLPLIETAGGVQRAGEIAAASPRVSRLLFGAGDLSTDVGSAWETGNAVLVAARVSLALASRAADLEPPLDTAFVGLDDGDGFLRETTLARDLGFAGKMCIHPSQVALAHQVFSPSPAEIEAARRIVAAYAEAEGRGAGGLVVDGSFVDEPIVRRARRTLEQAG